MDTESSTENQDDITKKGLGVLINSVKVSNELPTSGTNYVFYNSFPAFQTLMNAQASKILTIMQRCIDFQGAKGSVVENLTKRSITDRFDSLVEINDFLLEKIGANLDDASGVRTPAALLASTSKVPQRGTKFGRFTIPGSKTEKEEKSPEQKPVGIIQRPQDNFINKPDNSHGAFRPKLRHKPNAIQPLDKSLIISSSDRNDIDLQPSPHPYQMELEQLKVDLRDIDPGATVRKSLAIEDTPFMFIKTKHALEEMIALLKNESEIGVDLEANMHRTYLGMTCLMQISSWTHDFIVDTLALWDDMQMLNEIFTDPKIVKIFHDGSSDLQWLQRDFNIYVVNLFDTSIAYRYLEARQSVGLITLLSTYCDTTTNKKYQTSDWRRRPLPDTMIRYARIDSHYLPEICRHIRQLFVARERRQQLLDVWEACRQLCLKPYEKPVHTEESYLDFTQRSVLDSLNAQQAYAIQSLYNWRDEVARMEDESPQYVLPNHMLLMISKTLPREHAGVFACCNPVPLTVRRYIHDIHKHIRDAREVELKGQTKVVVYQSEPQVWTDSPNLPHDLSHREMHEPPAQLDESEVSLLVKKLMKESRSPIIRFRAPGGVNTGPSMHSDPLKQYRLSGKRQIENGVPTTNGNGEVSSVPPPPPPIPCTLPPPSPPPPPPPPQEEKQFQLQKPGGKKKKSKRKAPEGGEARTATMEVTKEVEIEAFDYSKAKLPRTNCTEVQDRMVNLKVKEDGKVTPQAKKKGKRQKKKGNKMNT